MQAETLRVPLGLDAYVPAPESNPLTREKVELGRALFFWKGLSRRREFVVRRMPCAGDTRSAMARRARSGFAGRSGSRRTPTLFNRAWGKSFFWDGRAATLEDQVLQPVLNPKEMDLTPDEIAPRVRADGELGERMRAVFGREAEREDVARALASYVRSILAGDSPYDQYVCGQSRSTERATTNRFEIVPGKGKLRGVPRGNEPDR